MRFKTKDVYKGIYSSHQRLKDAVNRMGLPIIDQEALSLEAYVQLLQSRLRTARLEEVKQEVERRLLALNAKPSIKRTRYAVNGKVNWRLTSAESKLIWYKRYTIRLADFLNTMADFTTSKAIVFLTLVAALSIQVHHLAHLVNKVGHDDHLLMGYTFASVSELTALMLTVHKARKYMLVAFALVQAWINVLYYCNLPLLVTKITLSFLIAFVIYSYSEIYTDSKGI